MLCGVAQCYADVSWCFAGVSWVLRECIMGVARMYHECCAGVSWELRGCIVGVARVWRIVVRCCANVTRVCAVLHG